MTHKLHCFMYVRLFNLEYECVYFKRQCEGFPGGSVVKNPPASAKDMGLIPGLGIYHVSRSKKACVSQLLSLCSRTQEVKLLSPHPATREQPESSEDPAQPNT